MNLLFLLWASSLFFSQEKIVAGDHMPGFDIQTNITISPFFNDLYKYGDITLTRGRRIPNVRIRIDLVNNTIQFISSNGIELMLEPGAVKEISYADTALSGIVFYKFRSGFPAIDGRTANHFYRVLADGSCSILELIEKRVFERRRDGSGNLIKEYETYEHPYLFMKGEMKKMRREKEFILAELADKQAELIKYMEENKLNLRNQEHIIKLVNYYNTL